MTDRKDAIAGFVSGPTVDIWFMHSLHNTFKTDVDNRFDADFLVVFGPYIHQNRNQMQHEFLDHPRKPDWLFSVDNDMVFQPEDVWGLFAAADMRGPGIYSAPYIIEDGTLVDGPWDDKEPMVYHRMVGLPERTVEVGVVGMGFTLIHRDVFAAVGEMSFLPVAPDRGEDVSFCWRAREAGYTPWLVPTCQPGHSKRVVVFPSATVRNTIGDEINLVEVNVDLENANAQLAEAAANKEHEGR